MAEATTGNKGEIKADFGACVIGAGSKRPMVGVLPETPAAGLHEARRDVLSQASGGSIPLEEAKVRMVDLGNQLRTGVTEAGKPACPVGAVNTGVALAP